MKKKRERLNSEDLALIAAFLAWLADGIDLLALYQARQDKGQ